LQRAQLATQWARSKPFAGRAAPAAMFYYSPDRGGEHPEKHLADYSGIMQAP
jgi:transposase